MNPAMKADEVKRQSAGRWVQILRDVCGLTDSQLNPNSHGPCPQCGGEDRFRALDDVAETGALYCNKCFSTRNGDGFAAIQWLKNVTFPGAVKLVAEALAGVAPASLKTKAPSKAKTIHNSVAKAASAIAFGLVKKGVLESQRKPGFIWFYHFADGLEAGAVVRWDLPNDAKTFGQIAKIDGGWICGGMPSPRPLYRLPSLIDADEVWICEGEKAADAGVGLGLIATTPSQGAQSPKLTDWEPLNGKKVFIVPDNDAAGDTFARQVIALIHKQSPDAIVQVVWLKDDWPAIPDKGDLYDFQEQFDSANAEALRDRLYALPDRLKEYEADEHEQPERQPANAELPTVARSYDATNLNDIGNAEYFAGVYRNELRYCAAWGKWLVWDGARYKLDDDKSPLKLAMDLVGRMFGDALHHKGSDVFKHVVGSANAGRLRAMLDLAGSLLPIKFDELDINPWLLNCLNGMIDLKSGELLPHDRKFGITKLCPTEFVKDAKSPAWSRFLTAVFAGDEELIQFVQRLFGYFLTGDISEQKLALFFGTGANGKSTLLNAFMDAIGPDYSMQCLPDFLMEKKGESHPTEKASLFGMRFVSCTETEGSRRLAEATVKMLTGGERIMARRMREDFWQFNPTHKLVLCTNHKPIIKGTDHGIWRRLLLIPFLQQFDGQNQNKQLPEQLRAESKGILAWAVQGCLDWQRVGLNPPDIVSNATEDYRRSEDILGRFLADCCVRSLAVSVRFSKLYESLEQWANDSGDFLPSKRAAGMWLDENGFERYSANGRCYRGLMLNAASDVSDPFP